MLQEGTWQTAKCLRKYEAKRLRLYLDQSAVPKKSKFQIAKGKHRREESGSCLSRLVLRAENRRHGDLKARKNKLNAYIYIYIIRIIISCHCLSPIKFLYKTKHCQDYTTRCCGPYDQAVFFVNSVNEVS